MKKLTESDRALLTEKGISEHQLTVYYRELQQGFPPMKILSNATLGTGIHVFSDSEEKELALEYRMRSGVDVIKFVPASGAASRMFKDLFKFLNEGELNEITELFFRQLKKYPFYERLRDRSGLTRDAMDTKAGRKRILRELLLEDGMNYGQLPKGSILFHRYDNGSTRTAFEEHFHEGAMYAANGTKGIVRIHFTLPHEGRNSINNHLAEAAQMVGDLYDVRFAIETDVQKPSTDTPAIDAETGNWVRTEAGDLLFRPAGHGALLDNLNDIDADVVFVKNIDNVVPDRLKALTVNHKELLGGVLLHVRNAMFQFLKDIDAGRLDREACAKFLSTWFDRDFSKDSPKQLYEFMHRPLRVCGMVKNEGEPGGGPFYVEDGEHPSLQIVEKAQIDLEDPGQAAIFKKATHFNPVDLVLAIKDYRGEKFDLKKFRNPNTGMVVDKTYMGRPIKALELPGLWNGAMHRWNSIFIEVPIETFNPVKTVFDLVRENHLV